MPLPSQQAAQLFADIVELSIKRRLQFLMPETLLLCLLKDSRLLNILRTNLIDPNRVISALENYLAEAETVPADRKNYATPSPSTKFNEIFSLAERFCSEMGDKAVLNHHYLVAIMRTTTFASDVLTTDVAPSVLSGICLDYAKICRDAPDSKELNGTTIIRRVVNGSGPDDVRSGSYFMEEDGPVSQEDEACMRIDDKPEYSDAPFVGRNDEVRKAAMALCRISRCNVVFVGDSGVGKSAMIVGLIKYIKRLRKRSRLGRAKFFKLNASLLSGNMQFSGELEPRLRAFMADVKPDDMVVLFADNMVELGPQGVNDNTPDLLKVLANMTANSQIRVVTTATFDLYKRMASHNPNVAKAFVRIDLAEPALEPEGRQMVQAAAAKVLSSHGVTCSDAILRQIEDVAQTALGHDVAMPGRAVDLIDSIGALIAMENSALGKKALSTDISEDALHATLKMLGYDSITTKAEKEGKLLSLEEQLGAKIYGQSEAVHGVAESVLLAKAGLSDDTKPLAAYLFVGPTGVGKTELAKVLASELGVKLVRFDMSEYSEAHSVAKLVGSPAGYVGYDDGGLLTDAVRKDPSCVLLFDEIEKANASVFNLLLQVLDYAQLTDNKGQKADFKNCIIIMTSNAGARFATGAGLGFGAKNEKSEVMQTELKRVFAPEFLNRLTAVVPFHDMDRTMAEMIFDRKVRELADMVRSRKGVTLSIDAAVRNKLIEAGFSKTYGAREMDRAIGHELKPALMRALLFGKIADGDTITVRLADDGSIVAEKSEKS